MIDIGVNLTHKSFNPDRDAVINRATAAGVTRMVLTGTTVAGSEKAADLAAAHPGMFATAGVHPHNARDCHDGTLEALAALASRPEVVAIGECGLDFNRDFSPRPDQERWFEAQVELAIKLGMPLFCHERDAFETFAAILRRHGAALPPTVVHCFTGDRETLEAYLAMGLYIGITGWICDERRGRHLQDLIALIPIERLMIETDAPFLTPRTLRPAPARGRNEPAFLAHVVETVAWCRKESVADVIAGTTRTAEGFFGLPAR